MKNAFNWDINQTDIIDIHGNVISGYKQITRNDTGDNIAVMKNSFHPMTTQQFTDTANQVAEKIGGDIKEFTDWSTGEKMGAAKPVITCQMEISEPLEIAGSKIEGKLTLGVGFDGGRSFFIGHVNKYLRCSNEFASIVKDFTSRLTKNNMIRVEDIIKNIGTYREYEEKLYQNFIKFQEVEVSEKLVQECAARIAGLTTEEIALPMKKRFEEVSKQKLNKIDEVMASLRGECAELGSTAWGMFNGVTHYTTHVMSNRGSSQEISTMFGAKNKANHIAYDMCMELIEA